MKALKIGRVKVRTVDVTAKEWFDRVNGNSYFSAQMVINYGHKTEQMHNFPIQYGYGDHYQDVAMQKLKSLAGIPSDVSNYKVRENYGITFRHTKHENCLKREVSNFGLPE